MHIGEGISGAIFSGDRQYRYALWRVWDRDKPAIVFIGLNPSRAGEYRDDNTVLKMICYSKNWGYGGLYVGNLFAIISPYPEQLVYGNNAIGDENDKYLTELKRVAGIVVVGWGNHGNSAGRSKAVLDILGKPVYCLAITKRGQPAHPLYLSPPIELKEYLPAPISV